MDKEDDRVGSWISLKARLSLIYAFNCMSGGFVTIFLPVIYANQSSVERNLSDFQIGIISFATPLVSLLGSPLLGFIADRKRNWRKALCMIALFLGAIFQAAIPFFGLYAPSDSLFPMYLTLSTLSSFFNIGGGSVLDAVAVEVCSQNSYGRLRLWCAVGYGGAALVIGVGMQFVPGKDSLYDPLRLIVVAVSLWIGYIVHFTPGFIATLVTVVLVGTLPSSVVNDAGISKTEEVKVQSTAGEASNSESEALLSLNSVASASENPPQQKLQNNSKSFVVEMILFLAVIFVCGCSMGVVNTFLFLFIQTLPQGKPINFDL